MAREEVSKIGWHVNCYAPELDSLLLSLQGIYKMYEDNGYRYLKNGDPSGDLCIECGRELYIQKGVTIIRNSKKRTTWELRCHCGYKTEFKRNNRFESAYK